MALAKTSKTGAVGLSGTCALSQVSAWSDIPTGNVGHGPYGTLILAGIGQNASASWYMYQTTLDGAPTYWARAYCLATANHGGYGGGSTAQDTFGTYKMMPPAWTWAKTAESYDGSAYRDNLTLYVMRDLASELPVYENGPSSATGPWHGGMKYAWGNLDGFGYGANADLVSEADSGHTMTPSWVADGGGTTDLGQVTIGVGISGKPNVAVSGVVAAITDIDYYLGTDKTGGPNLDDVRIPASGSTTGCHAEGSGTSLSFVIDDWTAIPTGGLGFSIIVYAPICIDWWLDSRNWAAAGGAQFQIIGDDGTGTKVVSSGYRVRQSYWRVVWGTDSAGTRPWKATVSEDTTWATGADEIVIPSDLPCVIESHGIDAVPDYQATTPALYVAPDILLAKRLASVNWQHPSGGNSLIWTGSGGVTVAQTGDTVVVTIPEGTTEGSISTSWTDHYFIDRFTAAGLAAYGCPEGYEGTKCHDGDPVSDVSAYGFGTLGYDSDRTADLILTLSNRTENIADNFCPDSSRIPYILANSTFPEETKTTALTVLAGSSKTAYPDLGNPEGWNLRHVHALEISGLASASGSWTFTLKSLGLAPYDPVSHAESGKVQVKVVSGRHDDGGLPINYVGLTTKTEAQPATQLGTPVPTQCGEKGLLCCYELRPVSGLIADYMPNLGAYGNVLHSLEGWSVSGADGTPEPWEYGHAAYNSHFVDDDDNDQLGGYCYTGDVGEDMDLVLDADGSAYVAFDVRPRVGAVYPASGAVIPVAVLKEYHGSAHCMVADENGLRDLTGATVSLQESGVEIATEVADHWGGVSWATAVGARENLTVGLGVAGRAPAAWYDPVNEYWWWVGLAIPETGVIVPELATWTTGVVYLALQKTTGLYVKRSWTEGATWTVPVLVNANGSAPTIVKGPTGRLHVGYHVSPSTVYLARSYDDGRTWSTITTMAGRYPRLEQSPYAPVQYVMWLDGNQQLFKRTVNDWSTVASLPGGATSAVIGPCDSTAGGILKTRYGQGSRLLAALASAGNLKVYKSHDEGATWTLIS